MKITRQELNKLIQEELQQAVESGELSEEQLQELLPGLKALGKAAWGGIKKGAAKVRDIYKSGEAEAAAAKAAKKSAASAGGSAAGQVQTQATPVSGQTQATPVSGQTQAAPSISSKQVPIFKATPDSNGDVLSMKLKVPFSKVANGQQLLIQYLKMVSNQLRANDIKLMEAEGDNLAAQLSAFKSKTAQNAGTAANIQKGSIDLFGPAVLLLKQAGLDQTSAVTLATQVKDLTAKHLQKYGVNLPQKTKRTAKPVSKPQIIQNPEQTVAQPTVTKQSTPSAASQIKFTEPVDDVTGQPISAMPPESTKITPATSVATPSQAKQKKKKKPSTLQLQKGMEKAGGRLGEEQKETSELNETFKRWNKLIKG